MDQIQRKQVHDSPSTFRSIRHAKRNALDHAALSDREPGSRQLGCDGGEDDDLVEDVLASLQCLLDFVKFGILLSDDPADVL
jgi:hypothetical protein